MGVYSSNNFTRYINFHDVINERNTKYQFAIFKTDRNNKAVTQWWSFLDIHPKRNLFLFDNFGFTGFKTFIIDNDLNIIDKLLYNVTKLDKNDEKINLINLKFLEYEYDRIKRKGYLSKLTDTAKDLFHFVSEFSKYHNVNKMALYAVDDQLQEITSDTCGIFKLYFYKNSFDLLETSQIIEHEKLTKQTIEKILDEVFSRDKASNEEKMKDFNEEYNL